MTGKLKPYTEEQYERFKELVDMTGSKMQYARLKARLELSDFVGEIGEETCDFMFERMKAEDPYPETLKGRK